MIKKISALVLALVLCLSVIVVPASAAVTLGDAQIAFALEWDKEYYKGGDTATLSVYMISSGDIELSTGSFVIGLNSAQISQADNAIDDVKANATTDDTFRSFYKGADTQLSWLATTVAPKVDAANTAEEQALYDHYLKYTASKDTTGGSHDNTGTLKNGFRSTDFDPSVPVMTISFVLAEDLADGTKINAAITTGSVTMAAPIQTTWKYIKSPGTATTTANVAPADFDVSQAVAEATVGTPAPTYPEFTINQGKDAIRFNKNADNSYKDISIRTTAEIAIADLQGACDGKTANDDIETYITEVGFVYIPATETFSVDDAKAAITAITEDEGESNGYTKKMVSYIQKTDTSYKYACVVDVKDEEIASAAFNTFAYICLDFDGDGTADNTYYYTAENPVSAKTLYNAKFGQANSTYQWTLAAK